MTTDKIKKQAGRPTTNADNRASLIAAAQLLFIANDYDKVSIRAIAREADLDPGLIRYYFQSKLGLFSTMISETVAPVSRQLAAMAQEVTALSPEILMQTYYQVMSQNPHFPKLIYRILSMKKTDLNQQLQMVLKTIITRQHLTLFTRMKENGLLQPEVDPLCAQLSFFSMMIFPFLLPDLLKSALGISITPEFMLHLGKQNSRLLSLGLLSNQDSNKDAPDESH